MAALPKMSSVKLCIICFNFNGGTGEEFGEENDVSEEDKLPNEDIVNKFATLLGRYLGTQFTTTPEQLGGRSVCQKCVKDLKRFCELFYQMERMQLELEWRLERILKEMVGAGELEESAERKCMSGDDFGGGGEEGFLLLQTAKQFRSDVISKCRDKLSMVQPMIFLTRVQQRQTNDKNKTFNTPPITSINERERRTPPVTFDMETEESCDFDDILMATAGVDEDYGMDPEHSEEQKFCPGDNDNITLSKKKMVRRETGKKIAFGRRSNSKKKRQRLSCVVCYKTFTLKSNVIRHLRDVHSMSLEEAKMAFDNSSNELSQHNLEVEIKQEREEIQEEDNFQDLSSKDTGETDNPGIDKVVEEASRPRRKIADKMNYYDGKEESCSEEEEDPISYKFSCPFCPKTFSLKGSVIKHLRFLHSKSLPEAKRIFRTKVRKIQISQKDLKKREALQKPLKCNFCSTRFSHVTSLHRHKKVYHGHPAKSTSTDRPFNCSKCSMTFKHRSLLKTHHRRHHPPRREPGVSCHAESRLGLSLKVTTCEICQAPLQTKMETHFASHHATSDDMSPEDMKRCDRCPAYFRKIFQLARHRRLIHGLDERRTCPECGKLFSCPSNLKFHLRTQHKFNDEDPGLPVPCTVDSCRKRFGTQEQLEWHLKFCRHDNEKDDRSKALKVLSCPECGRACTGPAGLKIHLKSHRGPSEYICEQCGVGFKTKWILRRHYLFHKGPEEWEYQCQECGKKCQTKSNLQTHMRSHSDDKPFVCQVCGKGYKDRKHLREHVNKSHGDQGVQDVPRRKAKPKFISRREAKN